MFRPLLLLPLPLLLLLLVLVKLLLLLLALLALALLDPTSGAFWLLLVYQSRADVTSLLWSMLAVGGSGYRGGGCMD